VDEYLSELKEKVEHHVEEEEGEFFPTARTLIKRRSGAAVGRDRGNNERRNSGGSEAGSKRHPKTRILPTSAVFQDNLDRNKRVILPDTPAGCCGAAGDGVTGCSASVLADSLAELSPPAPMGAFIARKPDSNFSGDSSGAGEKRINAFRSPGAAGKI